MPVTSRHIRVSFQKEGIHRYPAAKDLPGVEFLQYPHRHIFHFRVWINVLHNDRDIEFIQFKRWLERLYSESTADNDEVLILNHRSCEMISDELYDKISAKYPGRFVEIEVAEDGENGCSIYYPKS